MKTYLCGQCGKRKSKKGFYKDRWRPDRDGLYSLCKECVAERNRKVQKGQKGHCCGDYLVPMTEQYKDAMVCVGTICGQCGKHFKARIPKEFADRFLKGTANGTKITNRKAVI